MSQENRILRDAMAVIGDDWNFLIMRQAFFGVTRFADFMQALSVTRTRLSERLKYLTGIGVMHRQLYQTRPARYEYTLSDMGMGLSQMAMLVHIWADRWRSDPALPATRKTHAACGHVVDVAFCCPSCQQDIEPGMVDEDAGSSCQIIDSITALIPRWQRRSHAPKHADALDPIARALQAFGDRWSLLIIDAVLSDIHRFDDIQRHLNEARNVLTDRLNHLEAEGLLKRTAYQQAPIRYAYHPTESAEDLHDVLTAVRIWGRDWLFAGGMKADLVHRTCAHITQPQLLCTHCRQEMLWADINYDNPEMTEAEKEQLGLAFGPSEETC